MAAMHSDLHIHLGRDRAAERPRHNHGRAGIPLRAETSDPTIALRLAHDDEQGEITRLAVLHEAAAPSGEVLLGLVDGKPVAALSLTDGSVVADPFARSGEVVELLRLRADRLGAPRPRTARVRFAGRSRLAA
jgi:hypothetical protein